MLKDILHWIEGHQLPCVYKMLLKIDCPGCGLQRSFVALLRGDVAASFHYHPATIPLILLLLFGMAHIIFKFRKGGAIIIYSYIFIATIVVSNFLYKIFSQNLL